MSTVNASDVVIWSADVDTPEQVLATLDRVPELRKVKIDRAFVDANGPGIIATLNKRGILVFADAKIIEIPSKIEKLAKIHTQEGRRPWMLNMMANGLSSGKIEAPKPDEVEAMKRFADVCLAVGVEPCIVTVLTSKTDEMVALEYGKDENGEDRNRIDVVLTYLDVAQRSGFTNFVCSIAELEAIRAESQFKAMTGNHPGTRLPDSEAHDQASVGTPFAIIEAGGSDVTRLVIGRDLTGDDAAQKWARINANLRGEAA